MGEFDGTKTKADRLRAIDYLKRKARSVELQAARAAPLAATQLKSLAEMIAAEAHALESSAAG